MIKRTGFCNVCRLELTNKMAFYCHVHSLERFTDRYKRAKASGGTKAMYAVSRAIKKGDLPKLDGTIACVDCGKPACDYDHRDYSKPLQVEPVCRSCNLLRGPAKHVVAA